MSGLSSTSVLRALSLVFLIVLNACSVVESRRRKNHGYQGGSTHTRGADPLPWWAVTLIFVGGVLGLFLCFLGLKKVYEKKRKQKIRSIFSRRSMNIQRRRSQEAMSRACHTNGETPRCADAPPTYDQSVTDSLPPVYCKTVTDGEQHTPQQHDHETTVHIAPPSYEIAQNDGGEVVEVGGAVAMDTVNGVE